MWTDNETDQDLLGFSIHASLLRSIVTDPEMLPVTVGLFGDWGGGKSSTLRLLQRDLDQDDDFAVIYFNSWVFEGYEDAKSAILATLLNELQNHRNLRNIIGDEAKSLLKRVNWMRLLQWGTAAGAAWLTANPLPLLVAGGLTAGTRSAQAEGGTDGSPATTGPDLPAFLKTPQESVETIRSFRAGFQELIDKTGLKALVILIDDLDRCSPERLIQNLEAIKLFLNVDRTAFVVATDRRIVENAIRIRYSDLFTGEAGAVVGDALVTDYLEKLIQVPYTLPKLAPHEVRSYMCMLFLKKHLPTKEFDEVLEQYARFLTEERYAAFQIGDSLASIDDDATRAAVTESMRLVEACSDAVTDGLKGNPRQIKRFLNAFCLRSELAHAANITHLEDHVLIKLMVLEYMSGERFEELYEWHRASSDGVAQPLSALEGAEGAEVIPDTHAKWRTSRLWRWLKAPPSLADTDLRDYFWVARSSVAGTFAGVRLMTQAMRTCSEELLSTVETERQNGVVLFASLSEDEQEGVLGVVTRSAMQHARTDAPLRSLIDLAGNGHMNAAEAFCRCVDRIGADRLPAGLGITLRAFDVEAGNRASELVGQMRDKLKSTATRLGRALQQRTRKGTR